MKSTVTGETPPQSLAPARSSRSSASGDAGSAAPARSPRGPSTSRASATQPATSRRRRGDARASRVPGFGMERLDDALPGCGRSGRRARGSRAACRRARRASRRCPSRIPLVNGILQLAGLARACAAAAPAPCPARTWCAPPFSRSRSLVVSSIRPIDAFQRRSRAISSAERMPAFVCGSMPPSNAARHASTRYSAVVRVAALGEPLAVARGRRAPACRRDRRAPRCSRRATPPRDDLRAPRRACRSARSGESGSLREGAVGAAVAAQVRERDEDVARDADDLAVPAALRLSPAPSSSAAATRGSASRAPEALGRRAPEPPRVDRARAIDPASGPLAGARGRLKRSSGGDSGGVAGAFQHVEAVSNLVYSMPIQPAELRGLRAAEQLADGGAAGALPDGAEEADEHRHHLLAGDPRVERRARGASPPASRRPGSRGRSSRSRRCRSRPSEGARTRSGSRSSDHERRRRRSRRPPPRRSSDGSTFSASVIASPQVGFAGQAIAFARTGDTAPRRPTP